MAFEPKNEKIKQALGSPETGRSIPNVGLPNREEPELVPATYTLEKKNKAKLKRLAQANGYGKSTAAFLNDWIASVKEQKYNIFI